MGGADHFYQLSRRKNRVNIMTRIFAVIKLHLPLALFGNAGHDRERIDLLRIYADLFRKISLHDSAEHLLR